MNCGCMSRAARVARLAEVQPALGRDELPPSGQVHSHEPRRRVKRQAEASATAAGPSKRKKPGQKLSSKVDRLTAELAQMRALLMPRSPPRAEQAEVPPMQAATPPMPQLEREDDVISLAASASQFQEDYIEGDVGDDASQVSEPSSDSSRSLVSELGTSSMQEVLLLALERQHLTVPQQAEAAPASAFFRRRPPVKAFTVPRAEDFVRELQTCWRDTKACSHLSADGRALAAMQDPASVGLDSMPGVEPCVASLVVSSVDALKRDTRCPRPQCRLTDDLLIRAYDTGARAGRIGNSLSHLMLALSASLQEGSTNEDNTTEDSTNTDAVTFCDASLEAFGLMTRELGRMMSFLVQARRQVWLSQSSLKENARAALRRLEVEPATVFGPGAPSTLRQIIESDQTREQLASVQRTPPSTKPAPSVGKGRGRGNFVVPRPPPPRGPPRPLQTPRDFGRPGRSYAPDPGRPPTRAHKGRGGRR